MLLEIVEASLDEAGHKRRVSFSFSDSDTSEGDFAEAMEEISSFTDCLMDLAPALEHPAIDMEFIEETSTVEAFQVSSTVAANYCRRIRDRFPHLDIRIVERLAEANQIRSERLKELCARNEETVKKEFEVPEDVSEPLFSRSGGKQTETTKSTHISESIFSVDQIRDFGVSKEDYDDAASQTTFATFSTTFSKTGQGILRVPPMPESARSGQPFKCIACGKMLHSVRNRRVWK
jgi:hypothetical protein